MRAVGQGPVAARSAKRHAFKGKVSSKHNALKSAFRSSAYQRCVFWNGWPSSTRCPCWWCSFPTTLKYIAFLARRKPCPAIRPPKQQRPFHRTERNVQKR